MADIERITSPTVEDFQTAAELCYERWPYQRQLDWGGRFDGFHKLGVELAVMKQDGKLQAVAYMLPASMDVNGTSLSWVYMFQLASRPGAVGAGALLVRRIMAWYPAILGVGITPEAERMYKAFKWTYFGDVWRAIHPLNARKMLADYGERVEKPNVRKMLAISAGVYNGAMGMLERMLGSGRVCERKGNPESESKEAIVAQYLPVCRVGPVIAVNVGGMVRIGNRTAEGLGSLRQHAAIWREMRRGGAKACEILIPSSNFRGNALRLGYYPMRLPVWYWDPKVSMAPVVELLRRGGISFLDTDKVV